MGSGTITTAMVFVWMLNIMMVLSQFAVDGMTTDLTATPPQFVNYSGTIISSYSSDAEDIASAGTNVKNMSQELPIGAVPNSNMIDWITSATSWVGKQINTFTQIANAPRTMLLAMPVFKEAAFIGFASLIGIMWWGISFFLIVAFILGR